jgi:hypothetical protein
MWQIKLFKYSLVVIIDQLIRFKYYRIIKIIIGKSFYKGNEYFNSKKL